MNQGTQATGFSGATTYPQGTTPGYTAAPGAFPQGTTQASGFSGATYPQGTTPGFNATQPAYQPANNFSPAVGQAIVHDSAVPPSTEFDMHDRHKKSIFFTGPSGPHNFLRTLERDQNELRRLYNDFLQTQSITQRDEIKNEMIRGLSIHDFITETILFPVAIKELVNGKSLVANHQANNADFRRLLMTLDKTKVDDPTFLPTFNSMFQQLDMSMKQKQLDLFAGLQSALSPARAEELGKDLDKARTSAPTRPHTSAATSSVLGHLAAPFDKLKDTARDFAGASRETRDVVGK
eukprot:TRINITY_DN7424_c0_g1_i1.p1 TRINITY_DN7424_c0_g1~~TRINITY_DN7424_c0_g1_i1.p1  ORF type:complete len:321 (-),score=115.05 TRINITY_DN7424_c0_g1_i1:171-1049(-)